MASKQRYELKRKIGAGDFATVFEAEDTKLGREVAIKQLHRQFLDDSDKLARYWHEAQLLVSLEHPNIMTIYDVVKSHGSLVLELMQGSLKQIYGDQPMPVADVRQTIAQAAAGLGCLHDNGIIHGDIKPANLLLSRQSVVKLGDFGLARRASDAEGSMLKGTTKYMAPELVSDQFGDVGPASDLYSLGFSALELLVGPEFDSLFPDLIAFGRDQQMAWMMWHCSADRKLPRVQSVLDGVPNDVAQVIEKLTHKDQSQRYKSVQEVLADLAGSSSDPAVGQSLKEAEAQAAEAAKKLKTKRRWQAAAACLFSLVACCAIVIFSRPKPPPVERVAPADVIGVVQNTLPIAKQLVVDVKGDYKEYQLRDGDKITLNRKNRPLKDLLKSDRVVVKTILDPNKKFHREYIAFRPETQSGTIASVDVENRTMVFKVNQGGESGADFSLQIPDSIPITLNEKDYYEENSKKIPLTLTQLKPDDRVTVDMSDSETGMTALGIKALRVMALEQAEVRRINLRTGEIFVAYLDETARNAEGDLAAKEKIVSFRLDPRCVYTLNGLKSINDKLVKSTDIREGDDISLQYELKVLRLDAHRVYRVEGRLEAITADTGAIRINTDDAKKSFLISEKTSLELGGVTTLLKDLRVGDQISVVHESPNADRPEVLRLSATRAVNRNKWALLIGNQKFDDLDLPALDRPVGDLNAIRKSLVDRYAVPENQAVAFVDTDIVRWRQDIPQVLSKIPSDAEVYIYVSTHAFNFPGEDVFLAHRESKLKTISETGVKLNWLIDQIEACGASRKMLLLDCAHPNGQDPRQTSTEEMVELIKSTHRGGYPRKTHVLTSCSRGQSIAASPNDAARGVFAAVLSEGFAGAADRAGDNQLEFTELVEFVEGRMAELGQQNGWVQAPKFFTPDNRPPRISDQAKREIVMLMSKIGQKKLDAGVIQSEAKIVQKTTGDQPEPMLVSGVLLIKAGEMTEALEVLEEVRQAHPECLVAHEAAIWVHFYKRDYARGVSKLTALINQIPVPRAGEPYPENELRKFEWAGRLRELGWSAMKMISEDAFADWTQRVPTDESLAALDQAVSRHGERVQALFKSGRSVTLERVKSLRQKYKTDRSAKRELMRLKTYVGPIADERTLNEIREGLDR